MSNYWKKKLDELNQSNATTNSQSYWDKKTAELEKKKKSVTAPIRTATKKKKKKEEERKWFNSGLFEDGYDVGDITKTILGSGTDLVEDIGTGIIGMGEKAWDGLLMLGSAMNGQQMNQAAQNEMIFNAVTGKETKGVLENYQKAQKQVEKETAEYVKKDLYNEEEIAKKIITNPIQKTTGINVEDTSVFGAKSDSLIQSGGQLLATAGLQAVGLPWFVTTGATAYGSQAEQALNEGATFKEANASALISAGAEILTEKLSGGIKFGGETLDDVLLKPLTEKITSKTLKTLTNLGLDAVGEGSEEVVSSVMSNLGTALYKEDKVSDILFSEEAVNEYIESFIGGSVLGGVSSGIGVIRDGVEETYTENEQKVIDKEIENRIAEREQDGNKLTKKEKSKIREDVLSDLDKGAISIDTIEGVLGGETYDNYKSTVEKEDSLLKEFEELGNKTNATLKEQTRYKELADLVEEYKSNSQRSQIKSQLSDEVFNLAKGSRLAESYNEQTRKSQYYETDLNQYDEKQRAIVQKAIDSKVLNNTNRTHDFVDMVSKLSAEKGVLFDFTNNEKLKESGFAVEGKTVNGFVNENGDIVLNMDSHKAHRSVVGHEITHILEGTELYTELQEMVKQYATTKGEYVDRMQSLRDLYTGVYEGKDFDEKIQRELTADIVGDYLFTDEKFINNLSTEKPNLFKRIYNEIKYLYKVATAGSKEARELEKVKRAFDKAYKESGKAQGETKLSVSENTEINSLDDIKAKYKDKTDYLFLYEKSNTDTLAIENMVVKKEYRNQGIGTQILNDVIAYADKNGKTITLTPTTEFGTQNKLKKWYKANGFVENKGRNADYRLSDTMYRLPKGDTKYSLSDSDGKQLTKEQQDYFKDSKVRDEKGNLLKVYHGSPNEFTTFKQGVADGWGKGIYFTDNQSEAKNYGENVVESYLNITNPYNADTMSYYDIGAENTKAYQNYDKKVWKEQGEYKTYEEYKADGQSVDIGDIYTEEVEVFNQILRELGYDGIIADGSNGIDGLEIVAFNENQPKLTTNAKPTTNPDIRYSLSDSEGNSLTEEQQKFFKNSQIRDDNGSLKVMYHGSQETFTVFDKKKARSGGTYGKGFYFTDSTSHANTYGDTYDVYLNITNPLQNGTNNITKDQLRKFVEALAEDEDYGLENYGYGATIDSVTDSIYGKSDFGMLLDLNVSCVGDMVEAVELFNKVNGTNYDGIVAPTETVAFYPNQIKKVDNKAPTSNSDIRYSLSEADKTYLSAVEKGDTETVEKLVVETAEKSMPDSKVRDSEGNLRLVYHGRVSEFNIFDRDFAQIEGDFGKGFYFTDNEADVDTNYASVERKDLTNKISRYAERLEYEEDLEPDEAYEKAYKKFVTGEENTVTAYLNMTNPVYITPNESGTFLDFDDGYDEEADTYYDASGKFIEFVEALNDIAADYDWSGNFNFDFLYEYAYDNMGMHASDAVGVIKRRVSDELVDENGDIATNEIIRLAFEEIGYDGIIDSSVGYKFHNMPGMNTNTTHYIVFNSNQIKSADLVTYDDSGNVIPLSERFKADNNDIRYSLSKENDIAPIKRGNVPLKDLAYQPTVSKMEQVQNDILPIKEVVAKNTTTIPEEFAPMTEAEFNELNDDSDRLNSLTDNDMPPLKEAPYYEDNDVTHLTQKKVDDIAKTVYDYVFPKHGEKKVLKDVIQRYATSEIPDKYALFDEIKKVYGEKTYTEEDVDLLEVQNVLRAYPLKITDDIKAEYPEYADFMRKHKGRLLFANKGAKVDDAYQELSNLYPGYFPDDIWNSADQFRRMVEVSEMDRFATDTWELLDEDIQKATDIIADEVAKYTETQLQKLVEKENRSFYRMSPKYWEALMPPIAEGVSENTTPTKDIAPIKAVKTGKQNTGNMQDEKIAQILMNEPKVDKKKGFKRDFERFMSNFVDRAAPIETLALKTGNRELDGKFNTIRYADTKAQTLIGEGADGVKSINDIFGQVGSEADLEKFYNYLYHKHNVDRMSLESREAENLARLTEEMHQLKLDNLEEKQLYAIAKESTDDTTEKRAHIIETVREYLKASEVKNKPVYGDSVTAEISQEIVEKYEFNNPDFIKIAEDVYNYNRHLRNELVEGGVISQETADLFEELYPHYVPIRRVNHNGSSVNVPLDTRKTGVNAPIKRAQGGNSDILPLAQTMAQRTLQTYKAVAKNRFGVELKNTLGTTIESTETDVDEIVESVDTHEELLKEGKHGANPTFTVFENGEKVTFEITEAIYDALKPTSEALSKTYNVLSKPTGLFKKLVTEYNPAFMLTNPIKDTQDVLINSQHPLKTYKNYPKAISGLLSKKGRWYNEYMSNGGKDDSYFDRETNTFTEEKSGIQKVVGFPFEKISEANNFLERLPRLAEYIASREMGRSIDVAMLDSARVTTNFRAGGDVTKFLNRNGVTFLNPSVQGAVQQVRNVREAKANGLKGWALLATKVALAGLPGMLLNGLLWDDDEDYEELSDYVKQNYYIVWKNEDGKFIRIPKGRALAVIQDAFTQVQNALTGDDEVDINSFLELVANNLAPNNPLENNILAPIMQVKNNKTWYGEDLVSSRLADLPAKEQFDESTDKISRWLGDKLNISPVKINYLLNQYSGGVGDMILPMLTPEAESGKNSVLSNFTAPIRDKFTTDSVMNNQNVSNFYELSDELKVNANSIEATEEDILKNKYFNAIRTEMSELYKEKREIQNNEYLNDSEKYNRVREVQEEINALSEEALNSYNSVAVEGKYAEIGDKQYRMNNDNEWQKISDEELEKQNEVIGILGITKSQYWNNKKEYDMKAFYPEKYKVLQEQGISVEDYKENYEEMAHIYTDDYSWASDNPEKYTLSKAVTDDVSQYKQYTSDLYNIKADKDSNGKSITGSRKEKVHDYIFDLDIEDGAKYILFKSEYNADDTYNYEIIDYLNEREDISYADMETILKELGFEVDSQGNISW